MLFTIKNTTKIAATVLGLLMINSAVVHAQSDVSEGFEFDKLGVEESNWNFSSEDESVSVQDDIRELEEFGLVNTEDSDVRIIEEKRRWGNRGDAEDYKIQTDVYDY